MTFKKELARQFLFVCMVGNGTSCVLLCGLAKNGKLILGKEDEVVKIRFESGNLVGGRMEFE
jgi:hypothetical protein